MRVLNSTLALAAILATTSPSLALAQTPLQDRYGPPLLQTTTRSAPDRTGPAAAAVVPVAHTGPFLGWSGKTTHAPARAAAPPAPAAVESPRAPEPMALARQFAPAPRTAPLPVAAAPAPPPPARIETPPPAPQQAAFRPGTTPVLRGASLPAPAPIAPAAPPRQDAALLGGPPLAGSIYDSPPPRQMAAAPQAPAAPQMRAPQAPPRSGAGNGGQLYSLHREYGMTPDAIPAPPSGPNYILVGPPDAPAEAADDSGADEGLDREF